MNDDNAINSALNYIKENITILASEPNGAYISQQLLDKWNFTNYELKRGEVVTKNKLISNPSINGPSYGWSDKNDPIDKIYMFKNNMQIATFVLKNKEFVKVIVSLKFVLNISKLLLILLTILL